MKAAGVSVVLITVVFSLPSADASKVTLSPVQAFTARPSHAGWEGLAIVVNRNNPTTNVTLPQLRAMFFGERKYWPNGRRVTLTSLRQGTAERQTILRVIYKMDERALRREFFHEAFKGEPVTRRATLPTPAEMKKFVVNTPGAVGYLRSSDVDDSVRVVRVNGLMPGDDGYPLRLRAREQK